MTINELYEKAARVWGRARVSAVRRRPDGGAHIELLPAGIASDTRDRNYQAHSLDAVGHVDCHEDCRPRDGP